MTKIQKLALEARRLAKGIWSTGRWALSNDVIHKRLEKLAQDLDELAREESKEKTR